MIKELKILSGHGRQFIKDLRKQPVSERFRGLPVITDDLEEKEIREAVALCPVNAIDSRSGAIDLGKCAFCNECALLLPGKIKFTNDYRIASNKREDLLIRPGHTGPLRIDETVVREDVRRLFKKALKLREVSAGGDNSCEMELAATGNVNFDFGRYGIEFVASPRHADGIVITGPVTSNMARALEICYDAVPSPKIIILAGSDAISGGIFEGSPALDRSFISNHHIDLYLPGNPVHPLTFINGVMDLLGH
jgi:Ni,Fe-hydrogenase III small subunit